MIELRNILAATPHNLASRESLAKLWMELADYLSAENEYLKVHEQTPNSAIIWAPYRRSILVQGRPDEVMERIIPELGRIGPSASGLVLCSDTMLVLGNAQL